MDDLTPAQVAEVATEVADFVESMALAGITCVVLLEGRGADRIAYATDVLPKAGHMLERGLVTVRRRQRGELPAISEAMN